MIFNVTFALLDGAGALIAMQQAIRYNCNLTNKWFPFQPIEARGLVGMGWEGWGGGGGLLCQTHCTLLHVYVKHTVAIGIKL